MIRTSAVALLSLVASLFAASPAHSAEWVPGQRMGKAVARLMGTARRLSDISDFGYDNDTCILAAFLPQGDNSTFFKYLDKVREYMILAGGDDNAEDIDLEVTDEKCNKVAEDTKADASPVVRFTPKAYGKFTLKASAVKTKDKKAGSFVCVVILRRDGWKVPIKNLATAITSMIKRAEKLNNETSESVLFHDVKGQWALYGAVLESGKSTRVVNIDLGTGKRTVLGACDGVSSDIDLFIKSKEGKVVVQDTNDDNTPIASVVATQYSGAEIEVKNVSSKSPSLVLVTMLRVGN